MRIELKIKSKHLSEESRIIRFEERKLRDRARRALERHEHNKLKRAKSSFNKIQQHRRWNVRNEARATFLARAFLAERAYREVESKSDLDFVRWHVLPRVAAMVQRYGRPTVHKEAIWLWMNE